MAFKACLVSAEDNKPGIGMQYVFNHKADWVDASKFEGSLAPGWTKGMDFFVYKEKAYMINKTFMDLDTGETVFMALESTMGGDTKPYVEDDENVNGEQDDEDVNGEQ